jgi:S-formylglutathione hydrolase
MTMAEGAASAVSSSVCFGGVQATYSHVSRETRCTMRFGLYLPPQAATSRVPVLYWLSGLTCTEENFVVKAGAQRAAAELGLAIVVPDTSPRGLDIPGDADSYDFGAGAGFYVDATVAPWSASYRMYSYVARELPALVAAQFPVDPARTGIFGHSMGGHGALTIALKNPQRYRCVSAFAPIASPMCSPWGEKALTGYLGSDRARWRAYDATALIEDVGWRGPPILVDQGTADQFLDSQLKPALLEEACRRHHVALDLRMRAGYDHSYFFIATFVDEHLRYHASCLWDETSPALAALAAPRGGTSVPRGGAS